ncbi:MAG: oxidoreductase [Myxococcota bacterium]
MEFTETSLPSLHDQAVIVTGANSGIGFEASRALAERGAVVVLACRNLEKGRAAVARIKEGSPRARVYLEALDLADLASVRTFAERMNERLEVLHRLINNAGVMALPYRRTADGFEMQMGTNHYGHFALTGLLLDLLLAAPNARVVTVSSLAHFFGGIRFRDPNWENFYQRWAAYGQSKLANVLFAFELERRFRAAGTSALSVACHPGFASTNLQFVGPTLDGSKAMMALMKWNNRYVAQSAAEGALPTLYAAYGNVSGGYYIGPDGALRGAPKPARASKKARDPELAARLWALSEESTGVYFRFAG